MSRPIVPLMMALAACTLSAACAGSGDIPTRLSGQIVGTDSKPLGPGLVLLERGKVHEGTYQVGGLIDDEGRFDIELPSGGTWGIHIFHSDYQYLPAELTLEDHEQALMTSMMIAWGVWLDLTGLPSWPDQPTDSTLIRMPGDDTSADNPVLHDIRMSYPSPELLEIEVDVSDPDGDLARMILAYDPVTGAGYALNPPGPPNDRGDYPDGTYTLKVFLDEAHVPGSTVWHFVISDNLCNNTPVVQHTMPPLP